MPYSPDAPLAVADQIRLLVGDTDPTDALLSDAEVTWIGSQEPNLYYAAALAADTVAAKLARDVTHSMEGASLSASDQYRHYRELSESLRAKARTGGDLQVVVEDDLLSGDLEHIFDLGMHDND